MTIDTIVTAIGGATVAIAAIGVISKSIFDRTLGSKYKAFEEKFKIEFAEKTRRQGKIFDSQIEPLRLLVALVYKIRNLTRALAIDPEVTKEKFLELKSLEQEFSGKLHESRALLPEDVFRILHDTRYKAIEFCNYLLLNSRFLNNHEWKLLHIQELERLQLYKKKKSIDDVYRELDMAYGYLLLRIQEHLGISNEEKPFV